MDVNKALRKALPIRLGINKRNELTRLLYEICISRNISPEKVLAEMPFSASGDEKGGIFQRVKRDLVKTRYPELQKKDRVRLMPLKIDGESNESAVWRGELEPRRIIVEKRSAGLEWTRGFLKMFPGAEVLETDNIHRASKELRLRDRIDGYALRRETIFIVSGKASFIKKCPCTKGAVRCGYWVLNLGFGCPFDCSYCYLQTYSNIPGLVFAANIEEYCGHIRKFDASQARQVRIGTGEFTDSLALDKYTGYSSKLISVFRETKNLILELKTKTADIDNVLKERAHPGVVISWSINTPGIVEKYEKGTAGVYRRIEAAALAASRGYKVGFHFDPVVWYEGWEKEYQDIVRRLFSHDKVRENTVWISLGTLRYTPGLKQAAEQRFSDNRIFYEGGFFLDFDGKFRYPEKLRKEMYDKLLRYIKEAGVSCWTYLCMEPGGVSSGLEGLEKPAWPAS